MKFYVLLNEENKIKDNKLSVADIDVKIKQNELNELDKLRADIDYLSVLVGVDLNV